MLSVFFGFSGRIGRSNFLLVNLIAGLIMFAAFFEIYWMSIQVNLMGVEPTAEMSIALVNRLYSYLTENPGTSIAAIVSSGWLNYAASFKRFQDLGFQGYFYLIICFITRVPLIGPILYVLVFLYCALFPGEGTSNEFGAEKHSLFGDPTPVSDENWQDRVKSHRTGLREVQVEKNEAKAAKNQPRQRKTTAQAARGFGKRA